MNSLLVRVFIVLGIVAATCESGLIGMDFITGVQCAPGADADQGVKIQDNVCDCCGCKDNPVCRTVINNIASSAVPEPFNGPMCQNAWIALFNITSGMSKSGKNCPNANYAKVTREYLCQLSFGCCDGHPVDDINLQKVQNCASAGTHDIICESCDSLSAASILAKLGR